MTVNEEKASPSDGAKIIRNSTRWIIVQMVNEMKRWTEWDWTDIIQYVLRYPNRNRTRDDRKLMMKSCFVASEPYLGRIK